MGALPNARQGANRKETVMKFEDFYVNTQTLEGREVGVSAGEYADADCVLLQVQREDGNYECAYISREQAVAIGNALVKMGGMHGADTLPYGFKRVGVLEKHERFLLDQEDAVEFRVERHTDDYVWAASKQGELWGTKLERFVVGRPVFVLGGAL